MVYALHTVSGAFDFYRNYHTRRILTVEGPQLAVGQSWVANAPRCRFLTILTYNESSGIFSGTLTVVGGLDRAHAESYLVHGYKSPIGWTVGESSLCSDATYSGRLEYLIQSSLLPIYSLVNPTSEKLRSDLINSMWV